MHSEPLVSSGRPARRWALYAGGYMFICATVVGIVLSDILSLFAEVISLSIAYWPMIVASPAFVIGAVVWWVIVERRALYTYFPGALFGLTTALVTGILWTTQFIRVWGFEMVLVPEVALLIAIVLGVAAIAGVFTSVPLMYARRRSSVS